MNAVYWNLDADIKNFILTLADQPFDGRRSVAESQGICIRWLKEMEFSSAALNLIYHFMLSNLPYYQDNPHELLEGIIVPGEIGGVKLESSVDVIVCAQNAGAKEIALEVKEFIELNSSAQMIQIHDAVDFLRKMKGDCAESDEEDVSLSDNNVEEGAIISTAKTGKNTGTNRSCEKNAFLLLYLNKYTFEDSQSIDVENPIWVTEACMRNGIKVVLVHETDEAMGACRYYTYYEQVPSRMLSPPYNFLDDLAVRLYSKKVHRDVSIKKICVKLGATTQGAHLAIKSLTTYFGAY